MENLYLNIADEFSKTPCVRYESEGEFSGESFRKMLLLPRFNEAKKRGVKLIIILDRTAGLGTSFLEESFGGLIREDGISYQEIKETIDYISEENPDYIDEINEYLTDANELVSKA